MHETAGTRPATTDPTRSGKAKDGNEGNGPVPYCSSGIVTAELCAETSCEKKLIRSAKEGVRLPPTHTRLTAVSRSCMKNWTAESHRRVRVGNVHTYMHTYMYVLG